MIATQVTRRVGEPGASWLWPPRKSLLPMIAPPSMSTSIPSGTKIRTDPITATAMMWLWKDSTSAWRRSSMHSPITANACVEGRRIQRPRREVEAMMATNQDRPGWPRGGAVATGRPRSAVRAASSEMVLAASARSRRFE